MTRIDVDEARELWLRGDDEELQELAQAARARWHRARPRDLHGDADHQLHERLRRPVRLLRVLRPARTRTAATSSRARTCSRRSTSWSSSAATSSRSTAASTRSCRSTTTATCSHAVRERYGERVEFYALTVAEFVFLADRAGLSLRRRGRAAARRGRPLGHRRRQRDPHRGLPQAARQVEVHGAPTTSRRSARSSRAGCGRPRRW